MISVEVNTSLRDVLRTMNSNRIQSVPVMDGTKGCVGMIDTLELVKFTAYSYLTSQDASVMDDNLQASPEMFTQFEFEDKTANDVLKLSERSREVRVVDKDATLRDVAEILSYEDHRILVGRDKDAKLISQTDIVSYLSDRKDQLDKNVLNTPVGQLNIPKKIIHVSYRTPTIKAYNHLIRHKISALAVLDENQKLVGNLSASDLRGLTDETLNTLRQPVNQFIHNTGQKNLVCCSPEEKLDMAMNKLVENKVHRLWVTDEQNKPVGVLSLTDVIRAIIL
jgi:CBS domain-containing protein